MSLKNLNEIFYGDGVKQNMFDDEKFEKENAPLHAYLTALVERHRPAYGWPGDPAMRMLASKLDRHSQLMALKAIDRDESKKEVEKAQKIIDECKTEFDMICASIVKLGGPDLSQVKALVAENAGSGE